MKSKPKKTEAWLPYVKQVIRRYPDNRHPEENEAVKAALKRSPADTVRIIDAVFFKQSKAFREAAALNYLCYGQAIERASKFYKAVAENLHLPMDEAPPAYMNKYREDWHGYILAILSRYPDNRHKAETAAIRKTLEESDDFTRDLISRAYIGRSETAQNVAYHWNVNPITADHRKTAFFVRLAEALHLPTE